MSTTENVENVISHLSAGLHPADRNAFRRDAEAAVAEQQSSRLGDGAIHRIITQVWRGYFRPPSETAGDEGAGLRRTGPRHTTWAADRHKRSKLVDGPALELNGRPYRGRTTTG